MNQVPQLHLDELSEDEMKMFYLFMAHALQKLCDKYIVPDNRGQPTVNPIIGGILVDIALSATQGIRDKRARDIASVEEAQLHASITAAKARDALQAASVEQAKVPATPKKGKVVSYIRPKKRKTSTR